VDNKNLIKSVKISYILLATLPLFKTNVNSIIIIICAILTLYLVIKEKRFKIPQKKYWMLISLFGLFFFHEILFKDFNFTRILKHLPFLVIPLIFYYKPEFINEKIKKKSLRVFQYSTLLQSFFYFLFFIYSHNINKIFFVRNGIPFFREFVSENYFFEIHPTYFSSFLLISFTISIFTLLENNIKSKFFDFFNIFFTIFFIFLFSSRIIILSLAITAFGVALYFIFNKKNRKYSSILIVGFAIVSSFFIFSSKKIIKERFYEIKTEINKPVVGDYYNSTNTRVAIFKCSVALIKKVPFWGYGDKLQEELNNCYKEKNNSNFYKKHVFNTHNYYFNLINYGGWLFLVVFIIYILVIYRNIKHAVLGVTFLIQFLFINLTENYLSRHYGIVLFVYLTSMFIFIKNKAKN